MARHIFIANALFVEDYLEIVLDASAYEDATLASLSKFLLVHTDEVNSAKPNTVSGVEKVKEFPRTQLHLNTVGLWK